MIVSKPSSCCWILQFSNNNSYAGCKMSLQNLKQKYFREFHENAIFVA